VYIPIEPAELLRGKSSPVTEAMEPILRSMQDGKVTNITLRDGAGTEYEIRRSMISGEPSVQVTVTRNGTPITKEAAEQAQKELEEKARGIAGLLAPGMKIFKAIA